MIELQPEPTLEGEVTVAATRTDKRIDDQPMRVEVLGARRDRREDAHDARRHRHDAERNGRHARAGDVAVARARRASGFRACAGGTRAFLSDGLPLFGEQVGGLGLLQIPPMDLGQVEVIKGVASSLYGAGAMGGVVNLVSRRPGQDREREFLSSTARAVERRTP